MPILLLKAIMYGMTGMLIECWFTGLQTLIVDRNWRGTSQTYVPWMPLIYGLGGLGLEGLRYLIPNLAFIPVAVGFIYAMEFGTGWLLKKLLGRIPWDYGATRYGIMGLVRLDYMPFWLVVAVCYDALAETITRALEAVWSVI